MASDILVSCVVDNHPKFALQAWIWLCTLHKASGGLLRPQIFHIGSPPDGLVKTAAHFQARIDVIEPFGTGPAVYCNKLQQIYPLLDRNIPYYIFSDTDLAFLRDPANLCLPDQTRAKPVDCPNPRADVLRKLLQRAGFGAEDLTQPVEFYSKGQNTHRLNCNGGLYGLPRSHLQKLAEPWHRWARFCLQQGDLLGGALLHSDQLSFLLAMLETGCAFTPLSTEENFPMHFAPGQYRDRSWGPLSGVHYHWKLNQQGYLEPIGNQALDGAVSAINQILASQKAAGGYFA